MTESKASRSRKGCKDHLATAATYSSGRNHESRRTPKLCTSSLRRSETLSSAKMTKVHRVYTGEIWSGTSVTFSFQAGMRKNPKFFRNGIWSFRCLRHAYQIDPTPCSEGPLLRTLGPRGQDMLMHSQIQITTLLV